MFLPIIKVFANRESLGRTTKITLLTDFDR